MVARKGATKGARRTATKRTSNAPRKTTVKAAPITRIDRTTRDPSGPKTTRPVAKSRREIPPKITTAERIGRRLDAVPDRIDIRDWFYQPRLNYLPDQVVNCDRVPHILDQGREGACTGYALAGVINFLLAGRQIERKASPSMLYAMARRYDEWPGEAYEGSSARGAMKGWLRHGVADDRSWPYTMKDIDHLQAKVGRKKQLVADIAQRTPGGAFYRVSHRNVRDMHSAIAELGIIYCTIMVHAGWDDPGHRTVTLNYIESGNVRERVMPVIERVGHASDGHAIAIVGYTSQGFIIQNSWGKSWGNEGFALLPYEDFLLHATDVWAAQLGVPVTTDLWIGGAADTTAGLQRASSSVPLNEIRPFVVDVGNNGTLSNSGDYWTTERDLERLFMETIPTSTKGWAKRRVLLYLHGGLNDEKGVARRVVAFKDVMLANEIYPLHIMWETGAFESLGSMLADLWTSDDERSGATANWIRKVRDGLIEAKDRSFELTTAKPGGALWSEMKENARLASQRSDKRGAMQLIASSVSKAFAALGGRGADWELHVVGHSAGSIFAAHALPLLSESGIPFKSFQLMAPAIRVDEFRNLVLGRVRRNQCPQPTVYMLSDTGERDDDVGPYGKSLLYLVSNAFEGKRETPLLGMQKFVKTDREKGWTVADPQVEAMLAKTVDGLPGLVVAGTSRDPGSWSESDSHGGFDNDPRTLNSVLLRILGKAPTREFDIRDLQY
jgi:hypothetical protein